MNKSQYEKKIPDWCALRSFDAHFYKVGLCNVITKNVIPTHGERSCHQCKFYKGKKR